MEVSWMHGSWRNCPADGGSPQPMKSGCTADHAEAAARHLGPGPSVRTASSARRGRGGGKCWTQTAWSGCHKQGLRIVPKTIRGARMTRGDREASRNAVAFAAAVSRSRRQHDACRTRDSIETSPSHTQSDT